MPRKRVLYFTTVPLSDESNGGVLACRNHVRRLAADPDVELFVAVANDVTFEASTRAFCESLGLWVQFDYILGNNIKPVASDIFSLVSFAAKLLLQTPWDISAHNQPQIDRNLSHVIAALSIEVLIIDYSVSALYVQLPRTDVKTVLVKLNREQDFYRDLITYGPTHHRGLMKKLSIWRWGRVEKRIDRSVDQVVVIGPPDLPRHFTKRPPVCITPTLDFEKSTWKYSATKTAFFVGNIGHYPNRLAIEWIATKLVPEIAEINSSIKFKLVGVAESDVPEKWRAHSIEYMGVSDQDTVEHLFKTADVFLCPVQNTFGLKFKAAKALSFGTPLLASQETLLGLPYLIDMPILTLDNPINAACLVSSLVGNMKALTDLSLHQRELQSQFSNTQTDVWSRVLNSL